jgi:hypothetical protein
VLSFLLEFMDLQRSDGHEFKSLFVCVEPAPFLQGVFKMQPKSQALFAIKVHVTIRGSQVSVTVRQVIRCAYYAYCKSNIDFLPPKHNQYSVNPMRLSQAIAPQRAT